MQKLILFLTVCLLLTANIKAQQIKQVKGAKGEGIIAGRISESEARREALNQAKVEALRLAGVSEHLQSYELLFRSEVDHDYSEFFGSDIQSELQGAVQQYQVVEEKRGVDPVSNLFIIEVTIDATVILYDTGPDPAFQVEVNGIKGVYESGETLTFSVFSSMDAHLNIFNITDHSASLMYPNPWEQRKTIPAEKEISFPFGYVDYYLEPEKNAPEMNRLIFVFTKEPVPFLHYRGEEQATTAEQIFSWIYGLTPDIRRVDYQVFTIR